MPMARASAAVMRPKSSASLSFPTAPKGMACGENGGSYQTHGDAALKIGGKQQRQFGIMLQPVCQLDGLVRFAAQEERTIHVHRHGERADAVLLHRLTPLQVLGI